jgi:hypothetical protein
MQGFTNGRMKEVLEGSLSTLIKNNYPPILFEAWGDWKEEVNASKIRKELFEFLEGIGYSINNCVEHSDMYIAKFL